MKLSELARNVIFTNPCTLCQKKLDVSDPSDACPECMEILRSKMKNGVIQINDINIFADKFLFSYSDKDVRNLVLEIKYNRRFKPTRLFATLAAEAVKNDPDFPEFDVITHCPRTPHKKRLMGYDHSQMFAKYLAEKLDIPYAELIKRHEGGKEQKKTKNIKERTQNIQNKFYINKKRSPKGLRVLIVDDIITSGSTAKACAEVLVKAGAMKVMALFILD